MCARDNKVLGHQPNSTSCDTAVSASSSESLGKIEGFPMVMAQSFSQKATYTALGAFTGVLMSIFALVFPLLCFPKAATKTYLAAGYKYVDAISHFDNTFLTYGTDYMIAAAMVVQILSFPKICDKNAVHSWRSKALLASYAWSVFFGGICHQFYTSFESRMTWHFRLLWTLCVGSVSAAPGFMGGIATELVRQDEVLGLSFLPVIPGWFWAGLGTATSLATALGYFSFQRPACDIFVAGVTQSPSTFYLMTMLAFGLPTFRLNRWTRYSGLVGFIMMSASLPSYPLAVQYTNLSLGTVNALLHTWLMTAWTTQGATLIRISKALREAEGPPAPSLQIKRKNE